MIVLMIDDSTKYVGQGTCMYVLSYKIYILSTGTYMYCTRTHVPVPLSLYPGSLLKEFSFLLFYTSTAVNTYECDWVPNYSNSQLTAHSHRSQQCFSFTFPTCTRYFLHVL